jgi:hypothetical protein
VSTWARLNFWAAIEERLARLSNRLTADDVAKIRAAVHARVPRPSDAEVAQVKAAEAVEGWNELKAACQVLATEARSEIADHQGSR